jgi:hypothetical protein
MAVYKVSYVIQGSERTGGVISLENQPKVGEMIQLEGDRLEIIEVFELMPPRGDIYYFHATCKPSKSAG